MSGRKLGGGRVLGSGRSLSPATSPLPSKRNSSLLSPDASSISLTSSSSTAHTSPESQDLTSRISLEQNGAPIPAPAAASSRVACPICNEEMLDDIIATQQRHLDDNHKNLEEVKQDEVKDWFKVQMIKAKKFQPLAVLNQKLKGLDVFESNDTPTISTVSMPKGSSPARSPERPIIDPEEVVTRKHWQKPGANDLCSEPMCRRRLNATNGKVNCRKCGKLFCEDHTMYQIKLSRSAQHEPVRGIWCRVCETCYKSREGYNDHNGFERDHIKEFDAVRRKVVDKTFLEVSRLEKRLTRLTQLLANPPEQNAATGGLLWPLNPIKNQRKELEQSVVTWQDDATVTRCPFCQQDFSNYTFRRHHCRTCGRVVCADPRTGCSSEVGFNVDTANKGPEKSDSQAFIDIRMCKECKHTVFSKKDLCAELAQNPPDVRAYENLKQFERGIRLMMPKFHRLLTALQDPEKPPSPTQLADAAKVRKRLIDAFTQYDIAARRIRDLPTQVETQRRLQRAVYQQATNFLHLHMLPLRTLPKILKHASPNGGGRSHSANGLRPGNGAGGGGGGGGGALASIRYNEQHNLDSSSQISSSSAISALEEEEKALRDRLIVLEEQKFFVGEMIADANKRRKFDEVSALAGNQLDLGREIDRLQGLIAGLDFESVYATRPPVAG